MLHFPKRGVSHKLFGVVLHGRFICSLPFIYLVISLYQYGLLDVSVIIWFIIQYYFIYFAQIIPALAIGRLFSWPLSPFTYTHHCVVGIMLWADS